MVATMPEPQQQVLDVASEPLADRRVADLREPVAAVDVPVAGVHDAEEAGDLLVAEPEDRVGDELLGRAKAHQAMAAQHLSDRVGPIPRPGA